MLKWLEPAIEKRVSEVSEACEEQAAELYAELMELLTQLENVAPNSMPIAQKIENIFILKTRLITESSYKSGFEDGMYVGKLMK